MKIRLLPTTHATAAEHLALDEALMKSVEHGGDAAIHIYHWSIPATSIGYFQRITDAADKNKNIVRRLTGGGVLEHSTEIGISVVAPEKIFSEDFQNSIGQIIKPVMHALKELGINSKFQPPNTIHTEHGEISIHMQTRKEGVLLQHGTLQLQSYNTTTDQAVQRLRQSFTQLFRAQEGKLTEQEQELQKELLEKYESEEWVHLR